MFQLRPYQLAVKSEIYAAWQRGARNVMGVLPTGAGKTVLFSDIVRENAGASCTIAHRQELVSQISVSLARAGVRHRIIAPKATIQFIVSLHTLELGTSFYDPGAAAAVAGVDTLINRTAELGAWMQTVSLWVTDEGHHLLSKNKWGKGVALFPHARGLAVTATPTRADGHGLGRHADGVIDHMVVGPSMRELINEDRLTDYRIFAPPNDIDMADVNISKATGDYNAVKLRAAVNKSHVTGDVVAHYLKHAPGKLGVTFAVDVKTATEIAAEFNAAGVRAEVVSAKTEARVRADIQRRFRAREILQLVNVDLFGEGYDLPAIEVVSMARPTQSYSLYVQQFGRALRKMEGKDVAIIIDHVGNVVRHGLPDAPREWTLDRRERRSLGPASDVIPVKACPQCTGVYERTFKACPFCGFAPEPMARSGPEFVDGDLTELDAATLAAMRGEAEHFDRDKEIYREELAAKHVPLAGQLKLVTKFWAGQEAQGTLREAIALWAGHQHHNGFNDSQAYRRFFFKFGVDVQGAQVLKEKEARALEIKIQQDIIKLYQT